MFTIARVLLAGGEETDLSGLRRVLESAGHEVRHAPTVEDATRRVIAGGIDVLVLTHGLERSLEQLVSARCGDAAAIVVLAERPTVDDVRDALRGGASDVVDASAEDYVLLAAIERAAREGELRRELAMLRARVGDASHHALIGRSAAMTHVRELIGRAAGSRMPVVITGEAGTGKNVVARLVHDLSERAARPYATVHCGGVDQGSLERELFGTSERGYSQAGLLERVRGGTVVLEDALALPSSLRARLGRVGLSRTTQRVGGTDTLPADVRLILVVRHEAGGALDDVLDTFNATLIDVPPLRERRSDIPQLVHHFRRRFAAEQGIESTPMSPDDMMPLLAREWTGNVRELEHWVERASLASRAGRPPAGGDLARIDLNEAQATLDQLERAYILHVLELEGGHQSRAAVRLGIDRRTLYRKLKQYREERLRR